MHRRAWKTQRFRAADGRLLLDEIHIGHDDLPHGVIHPEVKNESVGHEMRDFSPGRIPGAEIWYKKWIGRQLVNSIQHLPLTAFGQTDKKIQGSRSKNHLIA